MRKDSEHNFKRGKINYYGEWPEFSHALSILLWMQKGLPGVVKNAREWVDAQIVLQATVNETQRSILRNEMERLDRQFTDRFKKGCYQVAKDFFRAVVHHHSTLELLVEGEAV